MNEHSKRLIGNILNSIRSYELKKITERELMQDIEGTCGAIDEHDIQDELYRFIAKIEDSRYLYGVEEGRSFLLKEIRELKNSMLDDQSGLLMGFDEVEHLEKQVMEKILAGGDEVLEILREQYKGAVVTERWVTGILYNDSNS